MNQLIARLHSEAPLTDVHAHPSLKAFLFRRNLWRHYWAGKAFDPFSSRTDFPTLVKSGVGVLWSALYLPERQLFEDCLLMRLAAMLLVPVYRKIMTGGLFQRLIEMMDAMEGEIARRPNRVELARSVADITRIRRAGKIAIVHTVEGAHVLEGDPSRIDTLAQRGVAMLTLSHFYPNDVASQVDGMPRGMFVRKLCTFNFRPGTPPPLTTFGRAVLRQLESQRMIVDVTHCTPEAREAVYGEVTSARPVVASHVGVTQLRPDAYNLGDDEIREIARRKGGIGVIFMPYWLSSGDPKNGLPVIWETMEHIHNVTGSWDSVMIGTDFDGFTDPPDDVRDASQFGAVTKKLLDRGLSEQEVMKVLGGNAMRILRAAWR